MKYVWVIVFLFSQMAWSVVNLEDGGGEADIKGQIDVTEATIRDIKEFINIPSYAAYFNEGF